MSATPQRQIADQAQQHLPRGRMFTGPSGFELDLESIRKSVVHVNVVDAASELLRDIFRRKILATCFGEWQAFRPHPAGAGSDLRNAG